jgi:riboflavin kinase/FMN adenylyltransferase
MKTLKNILDLQDSKKSNPDIGITIGNFDGVHLGHQFLIEELKKDCEKNNCSLLVVSFRPHPQTILKSTIEDFLINSYEEKSCLLEKFGADYYLELKFDREFSTQSPENFLENHLLQYPQVKKLYLGHDFTFGADKRGDFSFTQKYCASKNIQVEQLPKYSKDSVSSSQIRESIKNGNISEANRLLGRDFFLSGIVIKGEGRGKKIGFPTANIQVDKMSIKPQKGVYATKTYYKGMLFNSITNVGINPTFGGEKLNIETNIFDFDNDIYGEDISVHFLDKIRDEKKFSTVNDLVEQIKLDIESARKLYGSR